MHCWSCLIMIPSTLFVYGSHVFEFSEVDYMCFRSDKNI